MGCQVNPSPLIRILEGIFIFEIVIERATSNNLKILFYYFSLYTVYKDLCKMPKQKKTPARKKATKQSRKGTDINGSFINTSSVGEGVSTVHVEEQTPSTSLADMASKQTNKSDLILAYLEKLDQSNQALSELETSKSTSSTPRSTRTQPQNDFSVRFPANSRQFSEADQSATAAFRPQGQEIPHTTSTAANLTGLLTQGVMANNTQDSTQ